MLKTVVFFTSVMMNSTFKWFVLSKHFVVEVSVYSFWGNEIGCDALMFVDFGVYSPVTWISLHRTGDRTLLYSGKMCLLLYCENGTRWTFLALALVVNCEWEMSRAGNHRTGFRKYVYWLGGLNIQFSLVVEHSFLLYCFHLWGEKIRCYVAFVLIFLSPIMDILPLQKRFGCLNEFKLERRFISFYVFLPVDVSFF